MNQTVHPLSYRTLLEAAQLLNNDIAVAAIKIIALLFCA